MGEFFVEGFDFFQVLADDVTGAGADAFDGGAAAVVLAEEFGEGEVL